MGSSRQGCWEHHRTRSQSPNDSILSSAPDAKDRHISTGEKRTNSSNYLCRTGPKSPVGSTALAMETGLWISADP
jgi:hypothetical protein